MVDGGEWSPRPTVVLKWDFIKERPKTDQLSPGKEHAEGKKERLRLTQDEPVERTPRIPFDGKCNGGK